jgi:hypothetical protein
MRVWMASVAIGFCLILSASAARSGTDECAEALDKYNSVLSDLSDTLRGYARCVSDSKGRDDCALEFGRLKSAQDDFESAVSDYQSDCS